MTMAQTSVAQFASELKVPPSVLLEQLHAAGVEKRAPGDSLTEGDKARLLEYLRRAHGSAEPKNKITLTRKQTSEIKKSDAMGKDLKKRGFRFVGSTICYAFMQAVGMVNDHEVTCFRYEQM